MKSASMNIVLLPGDGIGPEIIREVHRVLSALVDTTSCDIQVATHDIGGASVDANGVPLTEETLEHCINADAVILGAVGGPQWERMDPAIRPENGLLQLRQELGVFANLRPVQVWDELINASPLREDIIRDVDILFVRELTGGIYFGKRTNSARAATDECAYTVDEIERVTRIAAQRARNRNGRLASVDKANVLETSRLWRSVVNRIVRDEFPELTVEHILVDAMAMRLVTRPGDFDVVLTENLFGDILTDLASALVGSLGVLPSAAIGHARTGLFEPIHGSAPDIAGKGIANPVGAILSLALALRESLGRPDLAERIEQATHQIVQRGIVTPDLRIADATSWSTSDVGTAIAALIKRHSPVTVYETMAPSNASTELE